MLTNLRAKNFKAWKDTGDIRMAPLTVLFGSNSAGKTSIPQLLPDDRIIAEYRANALAKGEPGVGDAFLKWVMLNEWNPECVTRVPITPDNDCTGRFKETPHVPTGVVLDPEDCKFLAVAAARPDRPPVLQAVDSKWWGWRKALKIAGVTIEFLCEADISAAFEKKAARR